MKTLLKSIFILLSLTFCRGAYGQDNKKLDFIIVIDENVWITNTYFQIIINKVSGSDTVKASYYPGNLSIKQSDYEKLVVEETKSVFLKIVYYEYFSAQQKIYNYEIELKKPWIQDYFNVLYIYNLNNKKYKKMLPISEGKNYTYELDSPNHTFRRIRNK